MLLCLSSLLARPACAILFACALAAPPKAHAPSGPRAAAILRGTDVLATVEGTRVTRRDFTSYWLEIDQNAAAKLGALTTDAWKAGSGGDIRIREADLYRALYADPSSYSSLLSGLISSRLVAIVAASQGITVTDAEARERAHEVLDQVRKQQGNSYPDARLMEINHIPPALFLEDMRYRVRSETLLRAMIAKANGHAIGEDDWAVVRVLFASAPPSSDDAQHVRDLALAHGRIQSWLAEIQSGTSMEEVARDHNEDATQATGGLNGAWLRGAGNPAVERMLFAMKPGQMSAPFEAPNGWYVFRLERRGKDVTEEERKGGWQAVIQAKLPGFLADLRRHAHITCVVRLPAS